MPYTGNPYQDELQRNLRGPQFGGPDALGRSLAFGAGPTKSTSINAPRLTQDNGVWTLNEHGNQRRLQANEVGDAQGYVTDFWQKFPTGFQPDNPNSLNDAYQQFTGRPGDAPGLAAHQRNPRGFTGAIQSIAGSDEAAAYRTRANTAGTTTPTPTGVGTVPPPTAGAVTPSAQRFEGFDFNRAQDTKKSAKDAFADLAKKAPPAPTHDKAALAQWFNQYIKPGMLALGHNVTDVQGDKFRFNNWQGDFWVDYGRGAGAPDGALAWQADDANAPPAGGGQGTGRRQGMASVMPGQQSDLLQQIMASLQLQQQPGQDPQALLLQYLQG